VTFRTWFAPGDVGALAGGDALARALADLCQRWVAVQEKMGFPKPGVCLHDPLTVALLVCPDLCPTEEMRLVISEDARARRTEGPPNARVAVAVDEERTRQLVLDTILAGGAP
jgi:inosine-uridine nucleoside N-ribohydrolase